MKKLCVFVLLAIAVTTAFFTEYGVAYAANAGDCTLCSVTDEMFGGAKSACVTEADGGKVIFSKGDDKRLPIASMTKIMVLDIVFEKIDAGELSLDESVTVSERASGMGGSQVFLRANENYTVDELIKSVVVASANDSSVALAEKVAGSQEAFVELMNEKAKNWGMDNTCFANATGLPGGKQYSTARDVSIMFQKLIKYDKFFEYSGIWLDSFAHPDGKYTTITNTNKLIRKYQGCDGGKTGYTADAGFCVAATAKRGTLRTICVVMGEKSSNERFEEVTAAFDYVFGNYGNKILVEKDEILGEKVKIRGGMTDEAEVKSPERICAFFKRGEKHDYKVSFVPYPELKAPIDKGGIAGDIILFEDGVEIKRHKAVVAEEVKEMTFGRATEKAAEKWKVA